MWKKHLNAWRVLVTKLQKIRSWRGSLFRWCKNIHNTHSLTSFFFLMSILYVFPGGQWPLGLILPLLVVLSEKQAPKGALHAPGPGAAGQRRLAPQTLHCHLCQWSTVQHLCSPLTPTSKLLHRLNRPLCWLGFGLSSEMWQTLRGCLQDVEPAGCQWPIQEPHEGEASYCNNWHCELLIHKVLLRFDSPLQNGRTLSRTDFSRTVVSHS